MKASFSIFVVFAVGIAIVGAEYDSLCGNEKSSVVPHPTDCRLFIHCKKGKGKVEFCNQTGKTPMYYDEKLKVCQSKTDATCNADPKEPKIPKTILEKCEKLHEGALLSNNKNCSEFYVCEDTWAYENICPNGMHYSNETESCGSPLAIGCKTLDTMCQGEHRGFTFASLSCEHYYECTLLGHPKLKKCPDNLFYGMVAGECVDPSESECFEVSTSSTTSTTTEASTHNVECAAHPDGATIADSKDSSKFYICTEHGAIHMSCPSDLVYSKKDGFCEVSKKKEFDILM